MDFPSPPVQLSASPRIAMPRRASPRRALHPVAHVLRVEKRSVTALQYVYRTCKHHRSFTIQVFTDTDCSPGSMDCVLHLDKGGVAVRGGQAVGGVVLAVGHGGGLHTRAFSIVHHGSSRCGFQIRVLSKELPEQTNQKCVRLVIAIYSWMDGGTQSRYGAFA